MTHICVSKVMIIVSDNGLSPGRRQAIIWTNAGILFIGPLGTNFSEILIKIITFSFKKMRLKVLSGKRRPFCLGLTVLIESKYFAFNYSEKVTEVTDTSSWGCSRCQTKVLNWLPGKVNQPISVHWYFSLNSFEDWMSWKWKVCTKFEMCTWGLFKKCIWAPKYKSS